MVVGSKVVVVEFHLRRCSSRGAPGRTFPMHFAEMAWRSGKAKHPRLLGIRDGFSGLVFNNARAAGEGHDPAHAWAGSIPRAVTASPTQASDLIGGCVPQGAAAVRRIDATRRGDWRHR